MATTTARANYKPAKATIDKFLTEHQITGPTNITGDLLSELFLSAEPEIYDEDTTDIIEAERRIKNLLAHVVRIHPEIKSSGGKILSPTKLVRHALVQWKAVQDEFAAAEIAEFEGKKEEAPAVGGDRDGKNTSTNQSGGDKQPNGAAQKEAVATKSAGSRTTTPQVKATAIAQDKATSVNNSGDAEMSNVDHCGTKEGVVGGTEDLLVSFEDEQCAGAPLQPSCVVDLTPNNDIGNDDCSTQHQATSLSQESGSFPDYTDHDLKVNHLADLLNEALSAFQAGIPLRAVVLLGKASGFVVQEGEAAEQQAFHMQQEQGQDGNTGAEVKVEQQLFFADEECEEL